MREWLFLTILIADAFGFNSMLYTLKEIQFMAKWSVTSMNTLCFANLLIMMTSLAAIISSIYGLSGVWTENVRKLYGFAAVTGNLIALELTLLLFASDARIIFGDGLRQYLSSRFFNVGDEWTNTTNTYLKLYWTAMQDKYECCGPNNYQDYSPDNKQADIASCCPYYNATLAAGEPQNLYNQACVIYQDYYRIGCVDAVLAVASSNERIVLACFGISIILQVMAIFLSLIMNYFYNRPIRKQIMA